MNSKLSFSQKSAKMKVLLPCGTSFSCEHRQTLKFVLSPNHDLFVFSLWAVLQTAALYFPYLIISYQQFQMILNHEDFRISFSKAYYAEMFAKSPVL